MPWDYPAFVRDAEVDVFISYAHLDEDGPQKWVPHFQEMLQQEIQSALGSRVRIFFDENRLEYGDSVDARLRELILKSAVLVPILSPSFLNSKYCSEKEISWFCEGAKLTGGVTAGSKCRIVPVVRRPAPQVPEPLAELNPFRVEFYKDAGGVPMTFPANPALPGYVDFLTACNRLGTHLKALLVQIQADRACSAATAPERRVFLALTSAEESSNRRMLVNYFRQRGFRVSGDDPPNSPSQLAAWTAEESHGAVLAVHLVAKPAPEDISDQWTQFEQIRSLRIRQLVVLPEGRENCSPKHNSFLQSIDNAIGTEVEAFRNVKALVEALPEEHQRLDEKGEECELGVFLLCSREDLRDPGFRSIRDELAENGCLPVLPAFQGDQSELRRLQDESVLRHNATVIYFASAPDSWVDQKRIEIRMALADREREERLPQRIVFPQKPIDDVKQVKYLDYRGRSLPDEPRRYRPVWVVGTVEELIEKLKGAA